MVIIAGKGGAGKDTVSRILREEFGVPNTVTYTTRAPRPGERDGVDHNFLTEEEFNEKMRNGFFAEISTTGNCMYGTAKDAFSNRRAVIILDPNGIRQVRARVKKGDCMVVYLKADDSLLRERMLSRGDDAKAVEARLLEDRDRFRGIEALCDLTIAQDRDSTPEVIAASIADFAEAVM